MSERVEIGDGAFGNVFKIKLNGKMIACKQYNDSTSWGFKRERRVLELLNKIQHPNIIIMLCYDLYNYSIYLELMDYDLEELIFNRHSTLMKIDKINIIQQIAIGLHYLDTQNVIHADLKPGNILVKENKDEDEGNPFKYNIKLCDFNSAINDKGINECKITQTKCYRCPEQLTDTPYDKSIDIFSFGCIIFEILTGDYFSHDENRFVKVIEQDLDELEDDEFLLHKLRAILGPIPYKCYEKSETLKELEDVIQNINSFPIFKPTCIESMALPTIIDDTILTIIKRCLNYIPSERLTAHEITYMLIGYTGDDDVIESSPKRIKRND